jgi:hypothetical protein
MAWFDGNHCGIFLMNGFTNDGAGLLAGIFAGALIAFADLTPRCIAGGIKSLPDIALVDKRFARCGRKCFGVLGLAMAAVTPDIM